MYTGMHKNQHFILDATLSIGNQCSFSIASVIWSYFPRFVIILAAAFNSLWGRLMM